MSSKNSSKDIKSATISLSLTQGQKSLFQSKCQKIPFSVALRQLIQYSIEIERNSDASGKESIEHLIACYERLPSSRESLVEKRNAKTSAHITEGDYSQFKELANKRVRRPANLLAILVDLFIYDVIPKNKIW
jgi:hypothetical protein